MHFRAEAQQRFVAGLGKRSPIYNPGLLRSANPGLLSSTLPHCVRKQKSHTCSSARCCSQTTQPLLFTRKTACGRLSVVSLMPARSLMWQSVYKEDRCDGKRFRLPSCHQRWRTHAGSWGELHLPRVQHQGRDEKEDCQGSSSHGQANQESVQQLQPDWDDQTACRPGMCARHSFLWQWDMDYPREAGEETKQLPHEMPAAHSPHPLDVESARHGGEWKSLHEEYVCHA